MPVTKHNAFPIVGASVLIVCAMGWFFLGLSLLSLLVPTAPSGVFVLLFWVAGLTAVIWTVYRLWRLFFRSNRSHPDDDHSIHGTHR